jgi:hypothetical protein
MDIRLPKMTLQPLIENAVKHGLKPLHADTGGKLLVRAEENGGVLSLHIIDNGAGMEYERWEVVQVALAEPGKQAGGRHRPAKPKFTAAAHVRRGVRPSDFQRTWGRNDSHSKCAPATEGGET